MCNIAIVTPFFLIVATLFSAILWSLGPRIGDVTARQGFYLWRCYGCIGRMVLEVRKWHAMLALGRRRRREVEEFMMKKV